jgi:hypothetical protein
MRTAHARPNADAVIAEGSPDVAILFRRRDRQQLGSHIFVAGRDRMKFIAPAK